uniref:Cytochrome c oxidase subunit 3 n=1 Tax=Riccardoella reaumuri TaxID=2803873 RepID=A0A7R7UNH2_9ACAR|nr:cytochrome oxidase subunit 3 [Riccardoella reaumuri]
MKNKFHKFHMITLSPWPLINSLMALNLVSSMIYMFMYKSSSFMMMNMMIMMITASLWWKDIIRESLSQGAHHMMIIKGLKMGMILFITSEVFFFISFFWAYFHSMLSPTMEIGAIWPPMNINLFNPMNVPLLNTIILISSGVSITWSHHSMMKMNKKESIISMFMTIMLGLTFSLLQLMEYYQAPFSMSDSIYSSTFFLSTGFHGLHVIIGSIFLMVTFIRMLKNSINKNHMISFEFSAWYWHFVDIVWLFLYLSIYWWTY